MADYPSEWIFDVVLKDGAVVRIRPIRPTDTEGLSGLFHGLSRESVYQRFFRVKAELTKEELEYFTNLDYSDRMAFVAVHEDELVGVGRYDRVREVPEAAEVAFAVPDVHQGRGIGTQLLQHLTAYARTQDITQFRAFVLSDNHAMMRVFRNAGYTMKRELEEGVYTVEFPTEESEESRAAEYEHEKRAIAASMMPIFYPHSIAVIGASRNAESIGGRLFENLIKGRFTGPVYPVNPGAAVVRSVRAYPSILEVPDPIDLAFIVVPAQYVIPAVEECGEKGVKGIVVISAGFGETGNREAEQELLEAARSAGMRMVGPNCMGVLNTDPKISMDGQFGPILPPFGNVAMTSQSGALGIAILDYARRLNIGISTFISMGNKADVSGNDLLLYWEDDPATDVILLYLESFGNPRRFSRIARRIGKKKPIVAVKSGRTEAGIRAASSHTGALASADIAVDALFRQAGVIRVDTLSEMFDIAALLSTQPVPAGRRVAVLTNAGGPGILAVDALESLGLEVPRFSDELQKSLRELLSAEAAVANPVDMIASASSEHYKACLDLLMDTDEVDSVMVLHIEVAPGTSGDVATAFQEAEIKHRGKKTLLSVFMQSSGVPEQLSKGEAKIPSYLFPEPAARALYRAVEYGDWRNRPTGTIRAFDDIDYAAADEVLDRVCGRSDGEGGWLEPEEVERLLGAFGIPPAVSEVAASADEAVAIADNIGGEVVLKVLSPSALHKSDIGGVLLGVSGEDAVRKGFAKVTSVVDDAEGVLVQEYIPGGHEVLIGTSEDPNFGPMIGFGLGGVFVELIGDVSFRLHPLTDLDIDEMFAEVKSARLLEGYRGGDPGDVPALKETLARVSALTEYLPEIVEMDLNPVKVLAPGKGVRIVDARLRCKPVQTTFVPSRRDIPAEA